MFFFNRWIWHCLSLSEMISPYLHHQREQFDFRDCHDFTGKVLKAIWLNFSLSPNCCCYCCCIFVFCVVPALLTSIVCLLVQQTIACFALNPDRVTDTGKLYVKHWLILHLLVTLLLSLLRMYVYTFEITVTTSTSSNRQMRNFVVISVCENNTHSWWKMMR